MGYVEYDDDSAGAQSSEAAAQSAVPHRWPERIRLSGLLRNAFWDEEGKEKEEVDLQPLRRLVAALVQKSARHDCGMTFMAKRGLSVASTPVRAVSRVVLFVVMVFRSKRCDLGWAGASAHSRRVIARVSGIFACLATMNSVVRTRIMRCWRTSETSIGGPV